MALIGEITPREIADLIYQHASAIVTSDPRTSVAQARRIAADLMVSCYDEMHLAKVLRDAAKTINVPAALANVVAPGGGATASLADTDAVGHGPI